MKLNAHQKELFKTLTELNGVSGLESEISKFLEERYRELGYQIVKDNLGSIFAYKQCKLPNPKKVMVVAHMDEVGFIVSNILENGLIKLHGLGGLNEETLLSSRIKVETRDGKFLKGTINALPPHLMKKGNNERTTIGEMLADFGFKNKEDAIQNGVFIGAMVVFDEPFEELCNGRYLAKAIDDRYGLVLGLEMLEALQDVELPYDLYVGGSVQEEVGCRGALTSSYTLHPDFTIVLDCSPARDSIPSNELGKLGQGVLIRYVDGSMVAFRELLDFQISSCNEANVPYQYYDSPGGTDAGVIHKNFEGIPTLTHCICARSIHTASTIFDGDDYISAHKSLLCMLKKLDELVIKSLKRGE